jgi:hypothetical protein
MFVNSEVVGLAPIISDVSNSDNSLIYEISYYVLIVFICVQKRLHR